MEKIASFTVNHLDLLPGVYVSRKDHVGQEVLTTFDLRMCAPNREPVMNTAELHTIEHLAATYLRNEPHWKEKVIYFGPMGCRTGCYLILAGDYQAQDAVPLVRDTFRFIAGYEGEIPGAAPKDCGNYLDQNLPMARFLAKKYLAEALEHPTEKNLHYPEYIPPKRLCLETPKHRRFSLSSGPAPGGALLSPPPKIEGDICFFAEFPLETSI